MSSRESDCACSADDSILVSELTKNDDCCSTCPSVDDVRGFPFNNVYSGETFASCLQLNILVDDSRSTLERALNLYAFPLAWCGRAKINCYFYSAGDTLNSSGEEPSPFLFSGLLVRWGQVQATMTSVGRARRARVLRTSVCRTKYTCLTVGIALGLIRRFV